MPLLSSSRKAEEFARLLEGSSNAGSGSELSTLQNLASRLSAVPQPRAEFASALRDRLMSEAATTLPSAAGGAATGSGTAGSGGTGSGTGAGGTGTGGTPAGGAGSAGSTVSSATGTAGSSATGSSAAGGAASTLSTATAGGAASGGSIVSAVMTATAPAWAQFTGVVAATVIAIGGVGVGASQSLPGEPLYGVKRQIEQIQLDLAGGRTDTALTQLGFAHSRLSEIADLLHGRNADAALPADLQRRISELLTDWAYETSQGTTALLGQLSAGSGDLAGIRQKLTDFTGSQARALALVVQQLPDQRLQSLTGSAFAYLQRLDSALGNPVNLATLLPSVGLPLPTTTSPAATTGPSAPTKSKTGSVSSGGSAGSSANTPSSVPTLPIPSNGSTSSGGGSTSTIPRTPSMPTLPSGGGSVPGPVGSTVGKVGGTVGNTVNSATSGLNKTVNGVLNGVTGKGPSLPLPTTVPSVPGNR